MATGGYGRNPVDVLDKTSLAAMNYNVVKRIDPFVDEVNPGKDIFSEASDNFAVQPAGVRQILRQPSFEPLFSP